MTSLLKAKFNWAIYLLLLIFIRVGWIGLDWYSFTALAITLHQFMILFYSIGYVIPIRYLFGALMSLQMLLGPTFAYNGLDAYQHVTYQMKVPMDTYFTYAIPAVLAFIIGLHISADKLKGEQLDLDAIRKFVDQSGNLNYIFIGVGFFSSIAANFFSSELGFIFVLLGCFKYIGALLLLLGSKKFKIGPLILVFGSVILTSLGEAMFHDLLTWIIMMGAVIMIKFKPGIPVKLAGAFVFILLAVVIQQLKGDYRKSGGGGAESFSNLYVQKSEEGGIFSFNSLAVSNVRINQGFIVTNIMNNIPAKEPFANGAELYKIVEAAILPRILAPNKLNAGDRMFFMKYSGMPIAQGTSMGLSSLGDGYINFGVTGGVFFMFFLGLLYSVTLNGFYKNSKSYPVLLIFTTMVFFYPIRPDCELQTSLGHLFKSVFLLFVIFQIWKYKFERKRNREVTKVPEVQGVQRSNDLTFKI
jgi:hypothetical protein